MAPKKQACYTAKVAVFALFIRPYKYMDGADASRCAIGAANYHPLSDRREAPAIQRMKLTIGSASKLAFPLAAYPQPS